jgi:hypothetical protein
MRVVAPPSTSDASFASDQRVAIFADRLVDTTGDDERLVLNDATRGLA